ncbi:RICIN domain-containing protein [Kitasatospora misakiensis]|uniref:RICIN domain-containing protein n=1 Tax=Kitasatospora misakiensis TaxID=67330 RepID=A0ABW0X2V2_9ACTN
MRSTFRVTAGGVPVLDGTRAVEDPVVNDRFREPDLTSLPNLTAYGWNPQSLPRVGIYAPVPANRAKCEEVEDSWDDDDCLSEPGTPPATTARVTPTGVRSVALATAAVTEPVSTAPPAPSPFDGAMYQFRAAGSANGPTYNLDVRGGVSANGTTVQAYPRNCTASQNWRLRAASDGRFVLESALAPGMVLQQDLYSHNTVVWPLQRDDQGRSQGTPNQQWTVKDAGDGAYSLVSAADQRCLTMAGQESVGLSVKPCDGGPAQKWTLSVPCVPTDPASLPATGRTVPGYPALKWPTVKGHPELTWPSVPGAPGVPWPAVPGSPEVPMPGRPDLPVVDWPGAPALPKVSWPTQAGRLPWPKVPGFPEVNWPIMPGTKNVPWPILPLPVVPGTGPDAGTGIVVPGRPVPEAPKVAGHPELTWPTVPGFPDVRWPSVPGSPDVPWPGHPDMPAVPWPDAPALPTDRPSLPGFPNWTWPSIPGFPNVPWPSLPDLGRAPWPAASGFPEVPRTPSVPTVCKLPTDPGTNPTDPGTNPTDPGTNPTDPSTGTPSKPVPPLPGIGLPSFPSLPLLPPWGWRFGSGPGGPSSPGGPSDGQKPDPVQGVGLVSAADPQLVPDVTGGVPAAGTAVQAWTPNGTDSQKWAFWDRGDGNWLIETRLTYGGGDPGARLVLAHDTGSHRTALQPVAANRTEQQWRFADAGDGRTTVSNGNGCLTLAAKGRPLTVAPCDGSDGQKWRLNGVVAGGDGNAGGAPLYSAFPGKCADVTGGNTADRTPIDLYDCTGGEAQRWTASASSGVFALKAFGKCLDVAGSGTAHGTRVGLYACNDSPAQRWQQGPDSSLVNPNSGLCLDVTGGVSVNGTVLQIWDCNATDSQRWGLGTVPPRAPVTPTPTPPPGTGPVVNPGVGTSQVSTLVSANNGLVADLDRSSTASGTSIKALAPNGNDAQRWAFWTTANGRWILETLLTDGKAVAGQGMVMDHDPGPHRTHLIRTMDGNANQHWAFRDAGGGWFWITSDTDNGCLTASNPGEALAVSACDGTDRQKWRLGDVTNGPAQPGQPGQPNRPDPATNPAVTPGGVRNNQVAVLRSANNGMVADLDRSSTASGTSIKALAPNGGDAQKWAFWDAGNGRWILETLLTDGKAAAGQGMVMDHDPGNHRTHLIRTMDGNANQHWAFRDAGGGWFWVTSDTDNGCLTANNPGEALAVSACDGTDRQKWRLDGLTQGPNPPNPATGAVVNPGVANNRVATLRSANNGMVADLDGGTTNSGTSIKALGANGNDAQKWAFWDAGNGRWILETLLTDGKAAAGQGMVMDHDPGNHRTHLIRTMDGNANQHWAFRDAGGGWFWITSDTDNNCLTANNPGEALAVSACDGSDRQKWRLDNVADGPAAPQQPQPGGGGSGGSGPVVRPAVGNSQVATLRSNNNGLVADLDGGSTASGTSIKALGGNGNPAQRWAFWDAGNGNWIVETLLTDGKAAPGQGMVMDHNPGPHRTHLTQNQSGNANQRWSFRDAGNGWYWLVSGTDGGCLTANNAGEQLGVWRCDGSDKQRWRLDNVQTGPTPGAGSGGGNTGGGGGGGGGWDGGIGGGGSGGGNGSEPGGCGFQEPTAEHRGGWIWKGWSICRGTEISTGDTEQTTTLRMRDDGALELVYSWFSETTGRPVSNVSWTAPGSAGCGRMATMQTDGNFVVYGDGNRSCWSSGTNGYQNAWLEINRSGTLTIWWVDDNEFQSARARAGRPGAGLGGSVLDLVITIANMIPRREWGVGTQHRISTPNCGKIHCT